MLLNVTKYSGSYAKICAMKNKLLNEGDYKKLVECKNVKEIALYLKGKPGYKALFENGDIEDLDRLSFEEEICHNADNSLVSLRRFMNPEGKEFITLFVMEKEVAFLKQILRSITSESKYKPSFDDGGILRRYFSFDIEHISNLSTLSDLAEELKETKYNRLLTLFLENPDFYNIFNMEMALDTAYYRYAYETAKKTLKGAERRVFLHSYGGKIDMLNIMWILRCKKYFNVERETLKSLTIPVYYGVKKEALDDLINAHDLNEAYHIISATKYASLFEDKSEDPTRLWAGLTLQNEAKMAKVNPFSIFAVIEFINVKETEIKNLIKIAEATAYNLDKSEILKYITLKGGR